MAKRLTKKEAVFCDEYIETGNGTKSALKAYNTTDPRTAGKIANTNLNKNKIQTKIAQALGKHKIDENTIAKKIAGGLEARRVVFNPVFKSFEELEFPDYATQHKYLTTLVEILGVKAPDKHEHKFAGVLGIDSVEAIRDRLGMV